MAGGFAGKGTSAGDNWSTKIFVTFGTVLMVTSFAIGTPASLANYAQSHVKMVSYLHINGLQKTIHELYKMAGREINYKLDLSLDICPVLFGNLVVSFFSNSFDE